MVLSAQPIAEKGRVNILFIYLIETIATIVLFSEAQFPFIAKAHSVAGLSLGF